MSCSVLKQVPKLLNSLVAGETSRLCEEAPDPGTEAEILTLPSPIFASSASLLLITTAQFIRSDALHTLCHS